MSDYHENSHHGTGFGNGSDPQNASSPASCTYSTHPSQSPQSYTWNSQTGEYRSGPYTPVYGTSGAVPPPQNHRQRKCRGTPFGIKLLAVVLCCVITSAATLGVFVWMIQNGVVNIQTTGGNAAFTISRVVDGEAEETEGTVSEMSDQDIAEKVIPSVVCIQNYQVTQQYGFSAAVSDSGDVSPAGEGSGIVFSEDGYIVTNAHVIEDATSIKVILYDGSTHEAELIGSDELTDLAVIKIEAGGASDTAVTPAEFGSSEDMRVADKVMAIGNPGGHELSSSVTIGYVSALNRSITSSSTGYTMEFIQTDAAINPGNSGGALVNSYGQVIGINSSKISATGYEGLGFAIPTDTAQPIISDLIQYGYVKDRAMLGISGQYIDSLTGRFYGLPEGEYVGELTTQEARQSGLRAGDVIMSIDGTELTSEALIRTLVNAKKPGDTVQLVVYRASAGQKLTITLTLSEYSGG